MLSKIIFIAFIMFSIILILFVARIISRGIGIVARPPINPVAFFAAKICAFSSCFFIPAGIIWPELKWYQFPEWLGLGALLPFFSGMVIAAIAIIFHHRIILREEDYLLSKLGNEYQAYMKTTGRYMLHI